MYRFSQEERRYSVPFGQNALFISPATCEDLHAWSIYRQNLNSDFTDSALGSSDKSPLPYGNFQLRDATVQTILSHPRYGPQSSIGTNMYTYLKFGLPRVFPQQKDTYHSKDFKSNTNRHSTNDFDFQNIESSEDETSDNDIASVNLNTPKRIRRFRSEPDFQFIYAQTNHRLNHQRRAKSKHIEPSDTARNYDLNIGKRSLSEANLFNIDRKKRNGNIDQTIMQASEENLVSKTYHLDNFPILQVSKLTKHNLFRDVTFRACGNDLFTIMATSALEGKIVLKILAGLKKNTSGQIFVNGHEMDTKTLRKICTYVPSANEAPFDPEMDVQSTLQFHGNLRQFESGASKTKLVSKFKIKF